jgi:hypothetical protein
MKRSAGPRSGAWSSRQGALRNRVASRTKRQRYGAVQDALRKMASKEILASTLGLRRPLHGFPEHIAVSVNIGTVCQADGKAAAGEGRARHSVRAVVVLVGKRAAGRGLPALPAPLCQSQCELLYQTAPIATGTAVSRWPRKAVCTRMRMKPSLQCKFGHRRSSFQKM